MKLFSVATKTILKDGSDKWDTRPATKAEAMHILVSNGWTEEQANHDLARCPDDWIIVNSCTQIC